MIQELVNFLSSLGYNVDTVVPDGKIHKFQLDSHDSKQSGWYKAFQNNTRNGEVFYVIVASDWRSGLEIPHKFCTLAKLSKEDHEFVKKQMDDASNAAEKMRIEHQEKVALEVEKKWNSLSETGESEYLKRKQIDGYGIRYDNFTGDIYVPIRDESGKIWSLQCIEKHGDKRFEYGARIRECFHVIGELRDTIYICEGFATGASVHLATGKGVVIAFNAGQLAPVASIIRKKYPNASIILPGDDDVWKDSNGGRNNSELAATKCLGTAIFPKFKNLDTKPTDFNDLHCLEGMNEVRAQLMGVEIKEPMSVRALGFRDKNYFFTSSQNRQVVMFSNLSKGDFLNLMPLNYWEATYPGRGAQSVDWTQAESALKAQARDAGIFQPSKIRGSGVWKDDHRIVVNMGDHLIVDGEKTGLDNIKSKYFYTLGENLHELHSDPLNVDECNTLVEVSKGFKWLKQDFGFLLAGALVASRICGALPVRPHVWITGGAQTGKSTLLEKLIYPILDDSFFYVAGGTTEAGIRQSLGPNAKPIVYDEFETTGPKSTEAVAAVIELLRSSWSDSSAMIVKGGATGVAQFYNVKCSAFVSSIRTSLMNDADRSRFAVMELAPHGSDEAHWKYLCMLLDQITPEYGRRLFSRTIKMLPVMLENFKKLKSALAKRSGQRFGDQYGMLLAGYSILTSDEPINFEEAEGLVDYVSLFDEKETAKIADHDDSKSQMLTTKITIERIHAKEEMSIGAAIHLAHSGGPNGVGSEDEKRALQRLGIRVDLDFIYIVFRNHAEMEAKIWRGTRWSQKWGNSLSRLVEKVEKKSMRVDSTTQYCLVLPYALFEVDKDIC